MHTTRFDTCVQTLCSYFIILFLTMHFFFVGFFLFCLEAGFGFLRSRFKSEEIPNDIFKFGERRKIGFCKIKKGVTQGDCHFTANKAGMDILRPYNCS